MVDIILSHCIASIGELRKKPMEIIKQAEGGAVGILNNNRVVFYCVPPDLFEKLMNYAEDAELAEIVLERANDETIKVSIDDLLK